MLPVAIVGLAINHALLLVLFRKELEGELPRESCPPGALEERVFSRKSAITFAVIIATVVLYTSGAPLSFTALGGFVVLLLVHREQPDGVWRRIDWSVLLFFSGLFIAVDALARSGAASWAFAHFPLLGHGDVGFGSWIHASIIFLIGSNVVTNVPFILVVRSEMNTLPDPTLGWELLAMASTFAGNLTLLGSVANVIVAEKARDVGGLRFGEYLKIGVPVATVTTLVGAAMLIVIR
jgi:Na+/H+ antiporter NhaD/arsenite permease-like protein